jgi:hypothetical protein
VSSIPLKDKIILEYPIPLEASVWDSDSLDSLLLSCLDDCQSDLELYDSVQMTYSPYVLPEGVRGVTSVKALSLMSTQSNAFVRFTFDKGTRQVACRFLPALVTYKRDIKKEDLDRLVGYRLQYFKAYVISKMLEKEISWLTAIKLESDTGSIDVQALQSVKDKHDKLLEELKLDILFPSNG